MNPNQSLLQSPSNLATIRRMSVRSDQARLRLREEMERQRLSTRDVAGILTWSQSRVQKLLAGRVELGVDDLEALCFALNLSLPEVVRDHGMEWVAELTPTELRFLQALRELEPGVRDSFLRFLEVKIEHARKHASPIKQQNKLRPGRALSRDSLSQKATR